MKLSELSTDKALDVMCELTPPVHSITQDEEVKQIVGKAEQSAKLNKYGIYMMVANRVIELIPLLLKSHRSDVYKILSIMNERPMEEIAAQKLMETMQQVRDLFSDEEFAAFFKSSAQGEQTEPSVPSANAPA